MREPLFTARNQAALLHEVPGDPSSLIKVKRAAALHRACNLAIESAFRYGVDLPVGAVALDGCAIVGRGFANDRRFGVSYLHAEVMAELDTRFGIIKAKPEEIVVSLEPCDACQDYFARIPSLKCLAFGLPRTELEARGLIKPHNETIFERAERVGLPYQVSMVEDDQLYRLNTTIFDYVARDPVAETVSIDTEGLNAALVKLNEE